MGGKVHPDGPSSSVVVSIETPRDTDDDLNLVLARLRAHVKHSINRGLDLEQLFRHFAHEAPAIDNQAEHPTKLLAGEQPEITPPLLQATLTELHIPSTTAIAKELVTRYSDGGCVLLSKHFKSMVLQKAKSHSQRRELVPKGLTSQRTKSFQVLPTFSGENNADGDADDELDPLVTQRFCLNPDQIVVQDDPQFAECFIPIQVSDLCNRLTYESRHDPVFAEHFQALSSMMRKLVYVRLYSSATQAFQLYADHDPDGDQQRTMRPKDYIGLRDVVGDSPEHSHTLNLRLFERVLASFCTDANYLQISEANLDQNWKKTLSSSLDLQTNWEQNAVEMRAFERGRRLVDTIVELNWRNLWGRLLPGTWLWLSPRYMCRKHKRALFSDNFGDWPPLLPKQHNRLDGAQENDDNDDDDETPGETHSVSKGSRCLCLCRAWIPWKTSGGAHTWYYWSPDGTLVQRRRVFSRLLVQFRVDKPQALTADNYTFVKRLASRHLAASGGGQACKDIDGNFVSHTRRATEQTSQFIFLKLFKDFPIDEIELARPFVGAEMKKLDVALIIFFTTLGLALTGHEAYEIATEEPCTEDDSRRSCNPNASFHEQTYGRLIAILISMLLYFAKAGFQWVNTMTAFSEQLIKTLFFRVVDNNRGALAVMLHEAEMQEQREAILCYFFLHFRWLGVDDNRFERRPEGAGMPRSVLDYEIEQWLHAVSGVKVNFDMEDAVHDLDWLGLLRHVTNSREAAEAIRLADISEQERSGIRQTQSNNPLRANFRVRSASKHALCRDGEYYCAAGDPSCTKPLCLLDLFKDLDGLLHKTADIDIPGLLKFEAETGRFQFMLHDKGIPYDGDECQKMVARSEFVIPHKETVAAAARFESIMLVEGPIRRYGISFLTAVRVRWEETKEYGEREVNLFGVNSYDPGGRTGDPHASEAVGGDCQMTITAIAVVVMFALVLGADEHQVRTIQSACAPVIEALHGRTTAVSWIVLQCLEAFLYKSGSGNPNCIVCSYPDFLLNLKGGEVRGWSGKQHKHTRAYLHSVKRGCGSDTALLPPQFFAKLRQKGQSEVLQPVPVAEALKKLDELGRRITKFRE